MPFQEIPLETKLAALWLLINIFPAMRVVEHARRLGRNPWTWFVASLLLTPIPFLWVTARAQGRVIARQRKSNAGGKHRPAGLTKCPHCRKFFDRRELTGPGGRCPLCGMSLSQETHA